MTHLVRILTLVGYFILASIPLNAAAVVVLDFGTGLAGSGGTITENSGQVSGSGILIGALVVQGTSMDGTYVVSNGALNFDTALDTISIVGGISSLGISDGTTLLTGSFNSYSLDNYPGPTEVFSADGPDTKDDGLLNALGIPTSTAFNFFGFTIESANGIVTSTDIINTAVIPVPAAVWLFGSGLLGLAGIARRKKMA